MVNKKTIRAITVIMLLPLLFVATVPANNIYQSEPQGSNVAVARNSEHYDAILNDVQDQIKKGNITFSHQNDKNGLMYNYGKIQRKDGAQIKTNIRVLKTLRYLTMHRGYKLNVLDILGTHSKHTTSGNISAHWVGEAVDINEINGKTIKWGGKKETVEVMKILNSFQRKYPHLTPKQLIAEGNGKRDYDVARYSMNGYRNAGHGFSYRVGGHQDHIHIGW